MQIKLATKIILVFALFFFLAGVLTVVLLREELRDKSLEDARAQARVLLDENLAIHSYFAAKLKPSVFKLLEDQEYDPEYFDPAWMSSTYAVREIMNRLDNFSSEGYYYKECAINARSPLNEADDYEAEFIRKINRDPEIIEDSGIRQFQGKSFFTVLRRGEKMEENCLMCHSTPPNAPSELVRLYGPERSFHRERGEYVSAISIRIPLEAAYTRVNAFTVKLSLSMMGIFALLFGAVIYFNRRQLLRPLEEIRSHATRIADNPEGVEDEIPLHYNQEFNTVASSFNAMYASLKEQQEGLESKVRERTSQLEKLNATKDRFIRLLSHDLKNPFMALLSASSTLVENLKGENYGRSVQLAELINRGAKRANEKIVALLEWSRASNGKVNFNPASLKLADVVVTALEVYSVALENKSIGVKTAITPDSEVYADEKMLETVVENLLSNAIKYTPEGKSIHISDERSDGMLRILIRDEGAGLSKAELNSLFKIDTHFSKPGTNREEGTGFGLLISSEFMQVHGGSITVANHPDGGAVFTISLPVVEK